MAKYPIKITYADGTTEVKTQHHFRPPRKKYIHTNHWKKIRRRALKRDGHRCTECRRRCWDEDPRLKRGRTKLEVHHLTYDRIYRELLEDVVTLCQRCHATEHQRQRRL